MMSQILNYILGGIALILLFFVLLTQCSSNKKTAEIAILKNDLFACRNAPVKIDTVIIYDTIIDYRYIKPTPKPKPDDNTGIPPTSNTGNNNINSVYYSEVFKKEGIRIHWTALTGVSNDSAILQYVRFPEIVIPEKIVTQTKTVTVDKIVEVPTKVKSKFLMYGGVVANNIKEFPGVEGGIGYLHKQSWAITGGPLYVNNNIYGSVKFFIIF